eukprot:scaffold21764_cov15-Tisochrysis_lutea.AAC.1
MAIEAGVGLQRPSPTAHHFCVGATPPFRVPEILRGGEEVAYKNSGGGGVKNKLKPQFQERHPPVVTFIYSTNINMSKNGLENELQTRIITLLSMPCKDHPVNGTKKHPSSKVD